MLPIRAAEPAQRLRSRHPLNHPENQLTKSLARFREDPDRCAMVAALVVVHTFRYGLLVREPKPGSPRLANDLPRG
jgi:hypothetical protein